MLSSAQARRTPVESDGDKCMSCHAPRSVDPSAFRVEAPAGKFEHRTTHPGPVRTLHRKGTFGASSTLYVDFRSKMLSLNSLAVARALTWSDSGNPARI